MNTAIILNGIFGGRSGEREHAIEVFRRHVDEVQNTIPADRLLVYDVREGWEPLCSFLEMPVPDEPFPQVNDREQFTRGHNRRLLHLILRRHTKVQVEPGKLI